MGPRIREIVDFLATHGEVEVSGRFGNLQSDFRLAFDRAQPERDRCRLTSSVVDNTLELLEEEIAEIVIPPGTGDDEMMILVMDDGSRLKIRPWTGEPEQ